MKTMNQKILQEEKAVEKLNQVILLSSSGVPTFSGGLVTGFVPSSFKFWGILLSSLIGGSLTCAALTQYKKRKRYAPQRPEKSAIEIYSIIYFSLL
jgi:hypothetical protein